jgi:hypothetical protein
MAYKYRLTTLNQNRSRQMNDAELKSLLGLALTNGWRPLPHRIQGNELHMEGDIDEIEAMELAAALERALKRKGSELPPPLMIALLETIGVLRHGGVRLTRLSG